MTPHEALAQLQRCLSSEPEEIPEGWMTAQQWAEASDRAGSTIRAWLTRGQRQGIVEMKHFRVNSGIAGVRPVPYYRIKEQQ